MKRGIVGGLSVAFAVATWAGSASANETWGKQGDVVLAIERPFGLYFAEVDPEGPEEFDSNAIELGLRRRSLIGFSDARVGVDFFIIDQLSLGGGVGFASYDDPDLTRFLVAPRVGYYLGFSDLFGFWPRGGFTFYTGGDPDIWQLAVTLEGMFTISPSKSYAFMFGPVVDLGFAGEVDPPGPAAEFDQTEQLLGISVGMAGLL